MKRERVHPGDWKRQDWKTGASPEQTKERPVRGKHATASLHRRWQEAAEDAQEWKKRSQSQAREIQALTADVNLMPAMKERIASLEMQLSLATTDEIRQLNALVSEQREQVVALEKELHGLRKRYERLIDKVVPRGSFKMPMERMRAIDSARRCH